MTDVSDRKTVSTDGDDRGISVGRDSSGNAFVTGDNNNVRVVIYQSVTERRGPEVAVSKEIGPNPYMGLLAFHEEDAGRFFGREEQIARLWDKLRELQQRSTEADGPPRFLPILGPSGSGKSSLARAGLIPELARRPLPGYRDSSVVVLTPGSHPLEALARVLARVATRDSVPTAKTREFAHELRLKNDQGRYDGLRRITDDISALAEVPLIVLVDQFEEIYSLCEDKAEREAFVENLLQAAADRGGRTSVVITLRTDFLGETQTHDVLNRLVCEHEVMVPAMTEAELYAAIAKPAELAGHRLDEATIALLVSDAKDHEGALPLLQFALARIWDGLSRGVEPTKTYQSIGGLGGALADEAQRIYDGLSDEEKRIARRVFLGLVQLGEGTRDTRRRAIVGNLVSVQEDESDVERVIGRFADRNARLITLSADEQGAADTAEVTHEALFEHWRQLNDWLDESRGDIRFSRRLEETAHNWDEQGRPEGSLWSQSPNIDNLREFHERAGGDMSALQTDFYLASQQANQARIAKEKRQQNILRGLLAMASVAAVIAIAMFVWARNERTQAQRGEIDALVDSILLAPPREARDRMNALADVTQASSLRQYAIRQLQSTLGKPISGKAKPAERDKMASAKANLAVTLLKLGAVEDIRPLLKHSPEPDLRSYLIHRFDEVGLTMADLDALAAQIEQEEETPVLQALILGLDVTAGHGNAPVDNARKKLTPLIKKLLHHDDPGVHAASDWLLRRWGLDPMNQLPRESEQDLRSRKPEDRRKWYVNTQGQTFIIIDRPGEFRMGSPKDEPDRSSDEDLHTVDIPYRYAISAKEVTVEQFLAFRKEHAYYKTSAPEKSCPVIDVTWYDAAAYCNWLTVQEMGKKAAQSQLCYLPNDDGEFADGMRIHPEFLRRTGYRLPTEAEWEYACRSGTATRFCFGESEALLTQYAWYGANSGGERTSIVGEFKPNGFGLFDVHGNVREWCQDVYDAQHSANNVDVGVTVGRACRVLRGGSFDHDADDARAAHRSFNVAVLRWSGLGFRLARTYN